MDHKKGNTHVYKATNLIDQEKIKGAKKIKQASNNIYRLLSTVLSTTFIIVFNPQNHHIKRNY